MIPAQDGPYSYLYGTQRAELVPVLERALERAGIPYHSGLLAEPEPHVVFIVPAGRLDEARRLLERHVGAFPESGPFDGGDAIDDAAEEAAWEAAREREERERREARFPRGPIQVTLGLVLLHLALLFGTVGRAPTPARLVELGALVRGAGPIEPWRLVTSLFLHGDLRHVAWNGLSLVVFAVPAIQTWGYARAAAVYLAAGIGGGTVALAFHPAGTVLLGSSGAVAGLFGAWLAARIRRARRAPLTGRAFVRALGVALLALPSFLTPVTPDGRPISVAAHLGGLATGALAGWIVDVLAEHRRR